MRRRDTASEERLWYIKARLRGPDNAGNPVLLSGAGRDSAQRNSNMLLRLKPGMEMILGARKELAEDLWLPVPDGEKPGAGENNQGAHRQQCEIVFKRINTDAI